MFFTLERPKEEAPKVKGAVNYGANDYRSKSGAENVTARVLRLEADSE